MNTLTKRIITSVITAPGILALLFFAKRDNFPWAVGLFLAVSAVIGTAEFATLIREYGIKVRIIPTSTLAGLAFFAYSLFGPKYGNLIGLSTLAVVVINNLGLRSGRENLKAVLAGILALVYVPGLLHYFYLIYLAESGIIHAINLLFIVWGYDSGAYIAGRFFGSKKIAPEVSPNKTIEGVAGGLIVAFLGASLSPIWVPYIKWLPHIGLLAVLVGLAAQLGDLTESWFKRLAGEKDSGSIFPGHGGILDRIDGLLFALPVFYFYFHFILKFV
ncbi:MAG: phosphatidate cytidylyltransferase [Candidatus Bipolaricaulota bacterium]